MIGRSRTHVVESGDRIRAHLRLERGLSKVQALETLQIARMGT